MTFSLVHIAPTIILAAAVVDDMISRKVHNALTIAAGALAVLSAVLFQIPAVTIFSAAGMALAITLPLVFFKALGAGDMKIFVVFGIATSPSIVLNTFFYSVIWGSAIGLLQIALSGRLKSLFGNLVGIVTRTGATGTEHLHRIPYTVALFFGWLSYLALASRGGLL